MNTNGYPIYIYFINKISGVFQELESQGSPYISWTNDADKADVIMFESQLPSEINRHPLFKKYSAKCVAVSQEDRPSYYLPGCYSSNAKSFLTGNRTRTIPYIRMRREGPNPFIRSFINEPYKYLYAFKGGSTSWVRKKLFKLPQAGTDVYISASNDYVHFSIEPGYMDRKALQQAEYAELLKQSLFFLCPRGAGCGSIRLFEVMEAGRVPVIIADGWVPVAGINWDEISIRVAEKDIDQLDRIIRSNQHRAATLAQNAQKVSREYFAPGPDLKLLADSLYAVQQNRNEERERVIRFIVPVIQFFKNIKSNSFNLLRSIVLKVFALMGRKVPYSINRPA